MPLAFVSSAIALLLVAELGQASLHGHPAQHPFVGVPVEADCPQFEPLWQIVGPFQIGTREVVWGADPLEQGNASHQNLLEPRLSLSSSLTFNGTVEWTRHPLDQSKPCTLNEVFSFGEVDWHQLRDAYGWPALQYQARARTFFDIPASSNVSYSIHIKGVVEFWIDDEHYFGADLYSFGRAPIVARLAPGHHSLELRLLYDVRARGGKIPPEIPVDIDFIAASAPVTVVGESLLLPDVVEGSFVSSFASVLLTNHHNNDAYGFTIDSQDSRIILTESGNLQIAPQQTRELSFQVSANGAQLSRPVVFRISYRLVTSSLAGAGAGALDVNAWIKSRQLRQPLKITFENHAGSVSYAVFRPPAPFSHCRSAWTIDEHEQLPVMIMLHGAGLDADSDEVRHSLDAVRDTHTWTIFPTGGTPWSGDDWHEWGTSDILAALDAVSGWAKRVWNCSTIDDRKWLLTGHSNGAQGVWHLVANFPDKVQAAAAISGYSSIQSYVPYSFWRPEDPIQGAIVQAALAKYQHELLIPTNAQEIPIAVQFGSDDDNVPPLQSRRMKQLMLEYGQAVKLHELPRTGHWFEGIMTTPFLARFYHDNLKALDTNRLLAPNFEIIVADPASTRWKNGVRIIALEQNGRVGRARVEIDGDRLELKLSNVVRLALELPRYHNSLVCCTHLTCQRVTCSRGDKVAEISCCQEAPAVRVTCGTDVSIGAPGGLDAILRTHGKFTISGCRGHETISVCLQVSRNLLQYYRADARMVPEETAAAGNVIRLGMGDDVPIAPQDGFAVAVGRGDVKIRPGEAKHKVYSGAGIGAVFLRPGQGDGLELVIWGSDEKGLRAAARLMPTLTGAGQPDFIVLSSEVRWRGLGGTLALGFFNEDWEVSEVSYFR
ncbi:MAG: hypothetical protein Q9162_006599 [Coniocarpon cinnabarinum]